MSVSVLASFILLKSLKLLAQKLFIIHMKDYKKKVYQFATSKEKSPTKKKQIQLERKQPQRKSKLRVH